MNVCAGRSRFCQSPKTFFAAANASSAVTSPTIARIALFGMKKRVVEREQVVARQRGDASAGVPFSGMPYGWKP